MLSTILRVTTVAAMLCALAGAAGAQSRKDSGEQQVAQVPSWAQPYFKKYRKQPHFRALACARPGRPQGDHCFEFSAAPTARAAADSAMEMCDKGTRRLGIFAPCRLILVGDRDVSRMSRSQLNRAVDEYQTASGPPGLWPGFRPGPVKGVAGISMRKLTFTNGVTDYRPRDDLRAVNFSGGGFYIHLRWALNLALVKRLVVRYEVFDAAGRLVANRTDIFKPTVANWNTWHWIDIFKVNKPGKWKVSVYVSSGPGEAKVGETRLEVKPD